jgi:imidazole glycerol-phosphate synthase subunit HisF
MLAKRIIPCLDIANGRVVKGVHFLNLRDAGDPVEQARIYDAAGADELVFLDISATPEGRATTVVDTVRRVAEQVFLPLAVGGGIRTVKICAACCWPAQTRSASTRPPCAARSCSAKAPAALAAQCVVLAIDARRSSAPGVDRWEVVGQWRAHPHRPGRAAVGRRRRAAPAPAKSC